MPPKPVIQKIAIAISFRICTNLCIKTPLKLKINFLKIMAIYVLDHRCDVCSYSHVHNLEVKYFDLSRRGQEKSKLSWRFLNYGINSVSLFDEPNITWSSCSHCDAQLSWKHHGVTWTKLELNMKNNSKFPRFKVASCTSVSCSCTSGRMFSLVVTGICD